ncbi:uncharacterized protein LOC126148726 [Schistocerca cancellata]|uniref:uncharacterized protein LOC126148726 n=1 Tax=Schistocerca cancellata TaxID=274614 RepID=UPI0021178E51|nr:uncharacterized protein LOC126148726 [Schistocerca cancellata]
MDVRVSQDRLQALLILLAIFVSPGESLRCYVCSSSNDPTCEHSPRGYDKCGKTSALGSLALQVIQGHSVCIKVTYKDYEDNKLYIQRACAVESEVIDACSFKNLVTQFKNSEVVDCEICKTDYCNSGYKNTNQLFLSCLSLLFSFLVSYLW